MANGGELQVNVRVFGLDDVQRAMRDLPSDAKKELREGSRKIARSLAAEVKAEGRAESRQAARAASTVRPLAGSTPQVVAGPHPLLFGSEFGMTRKTGWYSAGRYYDSPGKQFREHRGSGSYWFFTTLSTLRGPAQDDFLAMARAITERWSA